MDKDEIIKIQSIQEYIELLGYKDKKEQEDATGFEISDSRWDSEYCMIYIDPFYKSILRDSIIKTKGTVQEILADFKKKMQYKRSKISRMETMRAELIQEMRKFFNDVYGIPVETIDDRDFVFKNYNQVEVGKTQFSFRCTYSSTSIDMNTYSHRIEETIKQTNAIFKFYYGIEASKIELIPLIRYEN